MSLNKQQTTNSLAVKQPLNRTFWVWSQRRSSIACNHLKVRLSTRQGHHACPFSESCALNASPFDDKPGFFPGPEHEREFTKTRILWRRYIGIRQTSATPHQGSGVLRLLPSTREWTWLYLSLLRPHKGSPSMPTDVSALAPESLRTINAVRSSCVFDTQSRPANLSEMT